MRGTLVVAYLLRRAALASSGVWAAGAAPASAQAAVATSIASLAAQAAGVRRGFAASASTSGRSAWSAMLGGRAVGGITAPSTRGLATDMTPSPLASANPVAALKARIMPATGRNQFRRKWRKQAEIKANHRRRLHQEALARARKASERKSRWAAAAARAAGTGQVAEAGAAAAAVV